MKLVGWFTLGGYLTVAFSFCAVYAIGAVAGSAIASSFLWVAIAVFFYGPLGAAAGALLALVGLLLQRTLPPQSAPKTPPAAEDTIWPPPPVIPPSAEQQSGD